MCGLWVIVGLLIVGASSLGIEAPWATILIALFVLYAIGAVARAWEDAKPLDLPTAREYVEAHGHSAENPIRCATCGSDDIENRGQRWRGDRRRVHRCGTCGAVLYRSGQS